MLRRLAPIATVAVLAVTVPATAWSAPTGTLTVIETAHGGRTHVIDVPPRSATKGEDRSLTRDDTLVITNPLRTTSGKAAGRLRVTCAVTKAGGLDSAAGDCLGTFALKAGRIYVTAPLDLSARRTTGTVLGGTGAYAGAQGTWTSVQQAHGSARDTFTFAP